METPVANQNIGSPAEVAVSQLQSEARYFEQLAKEFPAYKRSLGKHATDCRQVANNILKRFQFNSPEVLATSVRTANVFFTEGRRLRLKLRINLLQQESTGLELEAGRWPNLENEFKSLAEECRQLASICKTNISTGASSEIEESLLTATALYDKSIELRKKQKQERREDAASRLRQKVDLFKVQADELLLKTTSFPSLLSKYNQLSTHCLQVATRLEAKIEKSSFNEIENSISTADKFLERIKHSQTKAELSEQLKQEEQLEEADQEASIYNVVVPIRDFDLVESELPDEPIQYLDEATETNQSENQAKSQFDEIDPVPENFDQEVYLEKPEQVSFWARISHTVSLLKPAVLVISGFLAITFQKVFKFIERIFMSLIAGMVILTIVFVVIYLLISGLSNAGLF